MDLFINYFITYNINYICDHKKFIKGIVIFKIALTVAAISFNISQSNSKGPTLDEPFLLKLSSLYLLINNALKCHLCLFTSHIYVNNPFKKVF